MPTKKASAKAKSEDVEAVEETPEPKDKAKEETVEVDSHTPEELKTWADSLELKEAELKEWEGNLTSWQARLESQAQTQGFDPGPTLASTVPQDELDRARQMMKVWRTKGHVEKAMFIQAALDAGQMPPNRLMSTGAVKPQKDVRVSERDIPPRAGKGADKKSWLAFAIKVSTTDESVLERMTRDDIINLLEVEEIIPKPTEN